MKKIGLVFSFLIILHQNIYSQQDFWEQTNGPFGPFGGFVFSIFSNADQEIFVLTLDGMYKSTNQGTNWIKIRHGGYSNSVITPQNNLVIAESREVYLSTNSGNDWQQIYLANEDITTVGTDLNGNLFVATNYYGINFSFTKIYKSSDHGLNWSTVYSGSEHLMSFEFSNNNIYFGYAQGILKSTNGGLSWTHINVVGSGNCKDLEIDVLNNIYFVSGSNGSGVFRSTNDGTTWDNLWFNNILPISIETDSSEYIYLGTQDGIYISTDFGQSWFESSLGIQNRIILYTKRITNNSLLCGTWEGVYNSSDNGTSWNLIGIPESEVVSLFFGPQNKLLAGISSGGIFISNDRGNNWIGSGLAEIKINSIEVNSNNIIYAGGVQLTMGNNNNLFSSSDFGINWAPLSQSFAEISKILINSQNFIFIATYGSGVYRSTDNGLTWEEKNSGLTSYFINAIAFNSNNEIFAGTDYYGICKSTDAGNTWQQIGLPDCSIYDIEINSVDEIYISICQYYQMYTIYKSTDNGVTWVEFNSGIPNYPVRILTKNDKDEIFAGTESNGVYALFKDSTTWTSINIGLTDLGINDLLVDSYGYLYAGTSNGVFRSKNTTTDISQDKVFFIEGAYLSICYPNPFNPSTKINYQLTHASKVTLKVYDILGKEVEILIDEVKNAGSYEIEFNGNNLPSGVYFYQLKAGDYVETKKMILLK